MYVATLRSKHPMGMQGGAHIRVKRRGEATCLADLYQAVPLRVLMPDPAPGEPLLAVLVTTSGGLVAGDRLTVSAVVEPDCTLSIMAQSAEKVYRSTGADCHVTVSLRAEAGSFLEYLPQETILFNGARLRRETVIESDEKATILAGEIMVFGRIARGEQWRVGLLKDAWAVRKQGQLIWKDVTFLEGDLAHHFGAPAQLDQANCMATLILLTDRPAEHLEVVRQVLTGCAGATCVNGVLVVRWLGQDPLALRNEFAKVWCLLRGRFGLGPSMPRLWQV